MYDFPKFWYAVTGFPLSSTVDDFGNVVTLYNWSAIVARMDFILSEGE